jgi:hypothetical protein
MDEPSDFKDLMATVGFSLHAWAQVETVLGILFLEVSGIRHPYQAGAIFDSIVDFRSRLAMLDAAMEHSNASELELEIWTRLSARLRKLYKRRHEIAHFGISEADIVKATTISPFFTFNKLLRRTHRTLTKGQIDVRGLQFAEAGAAVRWLARAISKRKGLFARPVPGPDEEPRLIVQIRALIDRNQPAS